MNSSRPNAWRLLATAILLLFALSAAARAGIVLEGNLDSSLVFAQDFPEVGSVYVHSPVNGWVRGTGALAVTDHSVISAAHLFHGDDGAGGGIDDVRFYLGEDIDSYTHFRQIVDWVIPPSYVPRPPDSPSYSPFDISVSSFVNPVTDLSPASLFQGTLAIGDEISMVGYGVRGTNSTGYLPFDGKRDGGKNIISGFGGVGTPYVPYDPGFAFTKFDDGFPDPLPDEIQASPGMSGGPIFLNGHEIAAILSFGTGPGTPGSFLGTLTGAVNLTPELRSWILESMGVSVPALAGDYDADNDVDGDDFLLWQRTLGDSVPIGTAADGDRSTIIDAGDLTVWQTHFGEPLTPLTPVPEPTAQALAVALIALAAEARRMFSR